MFSRNSAVETVPVVRTVGPLQQRGKVTLTAWNLSDIAYFAIRETHDFQDWSPSVHDLVAICNEFLAWDDSRSKDEFLGLDNDDWLLKFAVGFSQKQFWYQELYRIVEDFNRQVELLEIIPREIQSKLDLDLACKASTGFDIRTFRLLLLGLFTISSKKSDLTTFTFDDNVTKIHPEITAQNIKKIIELYTADYQEFRKSELEENHFYLKPIIKTVSNKLIAVNQYFLARKIAEGPLWVIRDYYLKRDSIDFINEFGMYFERYIEKLFNYFLSPEVFERVPDHDIGLKADWFIYTPRYRLIIEQKSAMATLMMRRNYPDLTDIKTYLNKFEEGVCQLDATEKRYKESKRITIKILIHYETFHISDGVLRPIVVSKVAPKLNSTERIFFCDVGEFELLIGILGEQVDKAEAILESKILLEKEPVNRGREFKQVISETVKAKNKYVQSAINHWDHYFPVAK